MRSAPSKPPLFDMRAKSSLRPLRRCSRDPLLSSDYSPHSICNDSRKTSSRGPGSCASPTKHAHGSSSGCDTACYTNQDGSPTPAKRSCGSHATGPGPGSSPPRSTACKRSHPQPADPRRQRRPPRRPTTPTPGRQPARKAPQHLRVRAETPPRPDRPPQTPNQHPAAPSPTPPNAPPRPARPPTASDAIRELPQDRGLPGDRHGAYDPLTLPTAAAVEADYDAPAP
jgi:hypothetical protein